jgi:uncharacterized protein YpmB
VKIRITAAVIVIAGLLIFFSIRFFNTVQEDEWKIQRSAVQTAYEKTILTKADKVESYVGDQPYTVIHGEDKIGQQMIVWVGKDNIYTQMAKDGITSDQAKQLVLERQPAAVVLRLMPGVLNGNLVWEAFYKIEPEEAKSGRYYYDYYSFKDGTHIDTYRLSIE